MNAAQDLRFFAAPMQGFTEAPWRAAHEAVYADGLSYFTPFIRLEKGGPRPRDMRDALSPLNEGLDLTAQVIANSAEGLLQLVDALRANGHTRIDLNMGCPFPPQVKHGYGAGLMDHPDRLKAIAEAMAARPDVDFSLKMRLGIDDPSTWRTLMPVVNAMPLTHLTVHPRIARQQYAGELHLDEFDRLLNDSVHPVVFNGDILSPADIDRVASRYPSIAGIMVGRRLLSRPSLISEWRLGTEHSAADRIEAILRVHGLIFSHYEKFLCGEAQILAKIKPFWTYLCSEIDRKTFKAIAKASSLKAYRAAIGNI